MTLPVIYPNAKLAYRENISFGNNVIIDDFVFIVSRWSTRLGNFVHIASFASITGGGECIIGDYSTLSSGVRIFTGTEDAIGDSLLGASIPEPFRVAIRSRVEIGKHCMIGANSVVLPGVSIPDGVIIGAMSLVLQNTELEPWSIYAGSPVQKLRDRPNKDKVLELEKEFERDIYMKRMIKTSTPRPPAPNPGILD